jgi:glucosamine--fructose-6-phosphate aminotransferase (isomerizing)
MCGIIGYVGNKNCAEIVIEGLKKLEYRGYDSWGIAIKGNPCIAIEKQVGKISDFNKTEQLSEGRTASEGRIAMGHTRWATNGAVTQRNAHPHTCCKGNVAVVHNGIIENFQELKKELSDHTFRSETDTEIVAHLVEEELEKGRDFQEAVRKAISRLEGRFAVVIMSDKHDKLVAARKGSPLVVGVGENEHYVASDIPAFLKHTNKVIFLEDGDVASIGTRMEFSDFTGSEVVREPVKIDWNIEQAELNGHEHYMIKEIIEQKDTIRLAIAQDEEKINRIAEMIKKASNVFFVGCGTAGKVGMVGSYIFSTVAKKHVNNFVGSEFPNFHDFLTDKSLLVCISQSGETADTLEAIETARKKGAKVVSIINVMGSTMMRMSDEHILCNSGPEKAVCSTKVTTAQIAILTLIVHAYAGTLKEGRKLLEEVSEQIEKIFEEKSLRQIKTLARKLAGHESMYIIGRGINYPMALEGAIKMQEVPYIHAEGFAGGELKHGPIALIENGTPCVALVANDRVKKETLINALEIKSRGGFIIGIAPEDNEIFDFWIPVADAGVCSPIINIIPIQLLSYYTAVEKNCDPDKPRNLAKSVTVK